MPRLFLLDAYALIFRAYYAFIGRPMRNHAGLNTSPIFGFTKFLRDIIVREKPQHLGVAFDPKGGNFRHKLYPAYKANRAETPEDIVLAVPYIKRILDAMCIPVLEVPGFEADDVIGTLSVEATAQGFDTYMVTPDKDYGQLVSEHAVIYKQSKFGNGVDIVDRATIRAQYGIDDPRQVADILALWGDASDNVPGVPGVGEKGAMKLVAQFGSVEGVLAAATSDSSQLSPKLRENLLATRDQLLLSKRLVTIDTAVPIDFVPSELEMCDPDCPTLREIYNELNFTMFLREMATNSTSPFNSAILCRGTIPAGGAGEGGVSGDIFGGTGGGTGDLFGGEIPSASYVQEGVSVRVFEPQQSLFDQPGAMPHGNREAGTPPARDVNHAAGGGGGLATDAIQNFAAPSPSSGGDEEIAPQPQNDPEPTYTEKFESQGDSLSAPKGGAGADKNSDALNETSAAPAWKEIHAQREQSEASGSGGLQAAPAVSGLHENGNVVPTGSGQHPSLSEGAAPHHLSNIETVSHTYRTVASEEELRAMVDHLGRFDEISFDTETTGYDCFTDRMVGISLAAEPGKAFWIPLEGVGKASTGGAKLAPTAEAKLAILKPLLENEKIAKIGQNIKFDEQFLRSAGIGLRGRKYDTMVLHYLLDPESRHNMNHLSHNYLHYDPIQISSLIGTGAKQISMDMVPPAKIAEYAAEDADITLKLKHILWPMVERQGLSGLYLDIEEPLIEVLGAMEREGVKIDTKILGDYAKELRNRLDDLEQQIRVLASDPALNVNSAKQLGEVLFVKLRIGGAKPKMTKTRQFSTDEETLQALVDKHPVVGLVLEYRGVKKLLSTYVEALPQLINPRTGHVHTSYNQAVTATGRLSSTGPNLQNIPIREEQGRPIRQAFVPSDGDHLLLSADYSQVELRLMAHLSGDQALIEAFHAGEDIHQATAAKVFGVPLEAVTPEQRRRAKTANFGIIYGISAFGLSQRLGIGRTEASEIIDGYFRSYPGVKTYMEKVVADARVSGYVSTIFGRRRFLADINSQNTVARGLAERNAINAPIQGSAADIMKIAMIHIFRGLRDRGLRSKMILQVHDEVVIDMVRAERQAVTELVVEAMEHAASLVVDLKVDHGVGENWLDAH